MEAQPFGTAMLGIRGILAFISVYSIQYLKKVPKDQGYVSGY